MRNTTLIWLLISLGCSAPVSLRAQAGTQPDHSTTATPTPEETAVRNVVTDFYGAFARKDVKALTAMWSSKAPDFETFRKDAEEFFGSHEKIDIRDLTVSRVEIRADRASLRVQMEMSAVDSSTGKASEGLGKMWKDLELVRDNGVWKVWRNTDALSAVGAKIVASSNDQ